MYGYDPGYGMWGGMFGTGWMILGWLWMVLVWLIPILLLFALFKYLFSGFRSNGSKEGKSRTKTSLEILEEAYARGEVSREEFLQKREDLQKK